MGKELDDLERNYHDLDCGCGLCIRGTMMDDVKGFTMEAGVLKYHTHGCACPTCEAEDRDEATTKVEQLARHYAAHEPKRFPDFRAALEAVCLRYPKLAAQYLNQRVVRTDQAVD